MVSKPKEKKMRPIRPRYDEWKNGVGSRSQRIKRLYQAYDKLSEPEDADELPKCLLQPRVIAQAEYILWLCKANPEALEECLLIWKALREGLRHRLDLVSHPLIRRVQSVLQEAVEAVRNQEAESAE